MTCRSFLLSVTSIPTVDYFSHSSQQHRGSCGGGAFFILQQFFISPCSQYCNTSYILDYKTSIIMYTVSKHSNNTMAVTLSTCPLQRSVCGPAIEMDRWILHILDLIYKAWTEQGGAFLFPV